jgi:hypothetical protein
MRTLILALYFLSTTVSAEGTIYQEQRPIDSLTSDTKKILELLVEDDLNENLRIEVDKLQLLQSVQQLEFFKLKCNHVLSPPLDKIQELNGTKSIYLTSNNPILSKIGINLIHLTSLRGRTIYAKGDLNGESVYYKLEITKDKKVSLTYVPINKDHIPREPIVSDPGKPSKEKDKEKKSKEGFSVKAEKKGNGVKSTFTSIKSGKPVIIFEVDKEKIKAQTNISNSDDTQSITVDGEVNENGIGNVQANLSLKDKEKKNEIYAKAIIISEGGPSIRGIGYKYKGEHTEFGVEQSGEVTTTTAKVQKKVGALDFNGQVKVNNSGISSQGGVKFVSEDKKTIIQSKVIISDTSKAELSTSGSKKIGALDFNGQVKVNNLGVSSQGGVKFVSEDKKTNIQSKVIISDTSKAELSTSGSKEIGKIKVSNGLVLNEEGQKFSIGIERPLGEKTKLTSNVTSMANKDIILKAQIVYQPKTEGGKTIITASSDMTLSSAGEDSALPSVIVSRELSKDGKLKLISTNSAEFEGGKLRKVKGKIELNHAGEHGKFGIYVEGTVHNDSKQEPIIGAGLQLSHDMGGDGSDTALYKIHKLYKIVERSDQHIGYYFTWRYECNIKKKKIRIHKQKKQLFGKVNLGSLFSYALPKTVPMPKEVYSPSNISLETFCK